MTTICNILTLDRAITLAINGWNTAFGDTFFSVYTTTLVWLPMFVIIIALMWRDLGWKHMLIAIGCVALAVLLADQTCNLIKITVCRPRPTHEPELEGLVHTVGDYVGGEYGFCSSHAANTMAITLITSFIFRRWQYSVAMGSWVVLSCWSRIYLGVHYMGDVVCGVIVGAVIAVTVYCLWRKISERYGDSRMTNISANVLVLCYIVTIVLIAFYSLVDML